MVQDTTFPSSKYIYRTQSRSEQIGYYSRPAMKIYWLLFSIKPEADIILGHLIRPRFIDWSFFSWKLKLVEKPITLLIDG